MDSTVPSSFAATFAWNPTASGIPKIPVNQITLSPNQGHNVVTLKLPQNGFNYSTIRFITVDGSKTALTKTISKLNIRLLLPITKNQPFANTSRKIKTHVDASLRIIKVLENRQYDI